MMNKPAETKRVFSEELTLEDLNKLCRNNMGETLGIEFVEIGPDYLLASMPVDHRTTQPMGILHGGASVALAETIGSVAANCVVNNEKSFCVGLDINANHLRSVTAGNKVYGRTKPIHIGGLTQVWEILITNEQGAKVCISRLTMAVLPKQKAFTEKMEQFKVSES